MDNKQLKQIKFALMDKRKREFEKARRERKEQGAKAGGGAAG